MENEENSQGRKKRVKTDKTGRLAAFEKLKTLKGSKNKYEVVEELPVYEEVSEKDFSRLVKERQEDDWIVDDDGCGYVEDGREIFDDDFDEGNEQHTKKASNQSSRRKKFEPPQQSTKKKSDIKSMFKMQTNKRKNEEVKLDDNDDDLLGSIMEEVHSAPVQHSIIPKPTVLVKKPKNTFIAPSMTSPIRPFHYQREAKNPFSVNNPKSDVILNVRKTFLKPKVVNFDDIEAVEPETENKAGNHSKSNGNIALEKENINDMMSDDMDFNMSNDLFETMEQDSAQVSESVSVLDDTSKEHVAECSESVSLLDNMDDDDIWQKCEMPKAEFSLEISHASSNVDVRVDPGQLPLVNLKNGEQGLKFFWIDAFEDSFKQPGVVYLFGKVHLSKNDAYVSCCVIVKDIQRKMYVLPRETQLNMKTKSDTGKPVSMQDVYGEISTIAEKMKITEFRTKISVKNYAFDNADIPDKCEYLEVQYSAKYPPFSSDLNGATFSHVLGTDTSSLEILLLEQKIKGPCWLDIKCPQPSTPQVSWCKLEGVVNKIQHVVPSVDNMNIPPLVVLSLHLVTVVNSRTQQSEIVAISCLSHNEFSLDKAAPKPHYNSHFCALTKPSDCIFPFDFKKVVAKNNGIKIECIDSERALLGFFLAKLYKMDPDVIIGHDVVGFDLDVLLHRITSHKIPNWSRLGRLKRAGFPRFSSSSQGFTERNAACGRLICDIKISSKELIRCRSYDLAELSSHILEHVCEVVPPESVRDYFVSSQNLLYLVNNSMTCTDTILRINNELNTLPLALQITNIAGCVMSRTLLGGRSERNEYLLLHAFHEKNYIYPQKVQTKKHAKQLAEDPSEESEVGKKKGRKKPAYEGGLVLEPKKGFYDTFILLMDFNSLYPSIIQEYNICFTTLNRSASNDIANPEEDLDAILPGTTSETGILPTEIRKLVESRKQVKGMMKAPDVPKDRLIQYDIRQRALKLTANSMYGCLGFSHSRFYAKAIAALVTRKGREILMQTKSLVEKMGLDVIYGDTDSIMINTNQSEYDAVFQLGNKVKVEINKLYRLLEIDIDGVYKPMLLLKKKKYAAVSVSCSPDGKMSGKQEIKGLDIVRRDWSQLAKEAGEFVLKEILSTKSKEDILESVHSFLMTLSENIRSDKIPVTKYIILKQLTRQPEDYTDRKNLSHVLVAMRINAKGGKKLKQNDTVPYIICIDGTNSPFTQRAYHPDELKTNSALKIDVEYYLSNQVHPVVSRLCSPIEGTDSAMIATLLGLNPSKYSVIVKEEEQYEDKLLTASSIFDDVDRFDSCDKLVFRCAAPSCTEEVQVDGCFKENVSPPCLQLSSCAKCSVPFSECASSLCNQLQNIIRKYISQYYQRILCCDDSGCSYETKKMPLIFTNSGPVCPMCKNANLKLKYTEEQLYAQLSYFSFMFDLEKGKSQVGLEKGCFAEDEVLYSLLKSTVDKVLKSSGYAEVNLSSLFQGLFLPPLLN